MTEWNGEEPPPKKGHVWRARPGFSRLVLDRGVGGFAVEGTLAILTVAGYFLARGYAGWARLRSG